MLSSIIATRSTAWRSSGTGPLPLTSGKGDFSGNVMESLPEDGNGYYPSTCRTVKPPGTRIGRADAGPSAPKWRAGESTAGQPGPFSPAPTPPRTHAAG